MAASIKLTDAQVRKILLCEDSSRNIAKKMGVRQEAISRIRRGLIYGAACPDVPRWPHNHILRNGRFVHYQTTCKECVHYVTTPDPHHYGHVCSIGVPEIRTIGARFAIDCPTFTPEPCQQPHPNKTGPRIIEEMPPMAKALNALMQYQPA